jgi:streptomycin 6-kinase
MQFPENLEWLRRSEAGERWLASLPRVVSELAQQWDLRLTGPNFGGNVSYVVPASRHDVPVVLKVQWPHEECAYEADALRVWDGAGAVRLLAHDAARHALLLERCLPGTTLAGTADVDPLAVLIDLLPKLWKPIGTPFRSLSEEAHVWAATLYADWEAAGERCERKLIDATATFLAELSNDQGEQVLVHQDLHGDNVLAAAREPWLAIDPKPLAAERAFSLAPIIRSFEFGHSQAAVIHRLDRLSSELGLDRKRVCRWAIAQTVAWSFDSAYADRHYETARWLLAEA